MKKRIALSLILPCYNEGESIEFNVGHIRTVLDRMGYPYEIIFVDDASGDNTQAHIVRICKKYHHYRALYHATNQGRGAAVMDGIKKARGIVVGYIDIDCEVSPIYIPEIVDAIIHKEADIIIGKRIYRTTPSSLMREVLSVGYRWLVTRILDTHGIDTESGYKFFRRKTILPILPSIADRHWFWDTEFVVYANRAGLRLLEVPVLFIRRFDKKSSVRVIHDVTEYFVNLWRLRNRLLEN